MVATSPDLCGSLDRRLIPGSVPARSACRPSRRLEQPEFWVPASPLAEPASYGRRGAPSVTVTIYHDPDCETSRNVLALIRNSGEEPLIVEYLKTPPVWQELAELARRMGFPIRQLLRRERALYDVLGLDNAGLTDMDLIDAMTEHPALISGPIVVSPLGVRLCVPAEAVLSVLPEAQHGAFSKENGEKVLDDQGRRVAPGSSA